MEQAENPRKTPSDNGKVAPSNAGRGVGGLGIRALWRQINNMRTMCEKNLQRQDQTKTKVKMEHLRDRRLSGLEHFPWHLRAIWLISDSARLDSACSGINLTLKMGDENAAD